MSILQRLNRTTYHGCKPSEIFSVALVVANSSAPDCCNHASSVVPVLQILAAHDDVLNLLPDLFRRIGQ